MKRQSGQGNHHARIAVAWRDMRRGAGMGAVQTLTYGDALQELQLASIDALDFLVKRDGVRMAEFATALRIERSTATRALERLERAGLAIRQNGAQTGSGRSVVVHITARGRSLHAKFAKSRTDIIAKILTEFTSQEVGLLVDMLERFVAGIDRVVAEEYDATREALLSPNAMSRGVK